MRFLRRVLFLLAYILYAKPIINRTDKVEVLGFTLQVYPTVFHPKLYFSSRLLGEYVERLNLQNKRVLDFGTGSGIIGLCTARAGADVLSVDVNPTAVECTRKNAEANSLNAKMEVRQSNLFSSVRADESFDYIVWNPPFYPKPATDMSSHAWNAGLIYDVIRRFASEAAKHLKPNGRVIIILSSDMDIPFILSFFEQAGTKPLLRYSKRKLFETFSIYECGYATP